MIQKTHQTAAIPVRNQTLPGEEDSYDESTESDQEYDSESDYSDEEEGYYDEEG